MKNYNMRTIYLLELEQKRHFLYACENTYNSPFKLFLEVYLSFEYVQKYKPMNIIDQWTESTILDLDIQVKKQMLIRGIDNVRGGSYSSIELNKYQLSLLTTELQGPIYDFNKNVLNDVLDKYIGKQWSNMDIKKEHDSLTIEYSKYIKEKEYRDELLKIDTIEANSDIDWLEKICKVQYDNFISDYTNTKYYNRFQSEMVKKYTLIIHKLHKIYKTFMTFQNATSNNYLSIKYPEFIFDDFIFYGQRILLEMDNVHYCCNQYRYFLLFLDNRIEECNFDVNSWGSDKYYQYSINFLNLSIESVLL